MENSLNTLQEEIIETLAGLREGHRIAAKDSRTGSARAPLDRAF
jgi:hypothetical protein